MVKLIIFDYDGVLADSLATVINSVNSLGKVFDFKTNLKNTDFDFIDDMTYGEIMKKAGIPEDKLSIVAPFLFAEFIKSAEKIKIFKGIHDLLKELSKTNHIAVISGNTKSVIEDKFRKEKILDSISLIFGADAPGNKAEKIISAMKEFSCNKENTFMVGDSISDIIFAQKAKVNSIGVTWGWQSLNKLKTVKPDFIANSVNELKQILSTD